MKPLTDFDDFRRFLASFTNYEKFQSFRYGQDTLDLERMRTFAGELGNPQQRYPSIHIAGTKGKGATSLMLEALLRADGWRVGTYTSPHLEHLRERLRVDGQPIDADELIDLTNAMLPILERRRPRPEASPTFFELMTALAMQWFARCEVDVAIFEVGLGGRLDATNILSPQLTSITSIGLEHTHLLGDSLEQIAREKAGILEPGVSVVLGSLPPEARETIEAVARETGAPIVAARPDSVRRLGVGWLAIDGVDGAVEAPAIRGPALRTDLSIALELHRRWAADAERPTAPDALRRALATLVLPARVEIFAAGSPDSEANLGPPICLDGAHTTESIDALAATLDEIDFPRPRTLLFSLASDKNRDAIVARLPSMADAFVFTRADANRSLDPRELRDNLGSGEVIESPHEAFDAAVARGDAIVIAGSIYLAGELRGRLRSR